MSNTKTKECVEGLGQKARIYTADLSSQGEVSSLTKKVLGDSNDVSILLNCAGIQPRHPYQGLVGRRKDLTRSGKA